MPKAALLIAVSALLVAAACSSTPSPSGPPVGSLPDPAVFVTADALGALFADARLSEPACRYAQSNYRCIWTDTANSRRSLTVLVYADSQRVQQAIEGDGSRPVTIPGVSQAAVSTDSERVTVWSVVGERGLEVTFDAGGAGDAAAREAAVIAFTAALAPAVGS